MVTLEKLEDDIEHVAGGVVDPRLDLTDIANEAGRYLFDMHPLRFRNRPAVTLAFTEGVQFVELPRDFGFGDLIEVAMSDTVAYSIEPSTLIQIEQWRQQSLGSPGTRYYWAVSAPSQANRSEPSRNMRMEIYPTPETTEVDAVTVVYRAGWIELVDPEQASNVHVAFDLLLRKIARAITIGYVTGSEKALEAIDKSALLKNLKVSDGGSQSNIGSYSGGHLQPDRRAQYDHYFTTVNPGEGGG